MKLYLSSYRLPVPQELFSLVGKDPGEIKLAILPNAKDYYAVRAKNYKINEIITYQQARGIVQPDIVDLLDYRFGVDLYETLRKYDVVWAVGGNTFCLRQEMRRSGFDEVINTLLDEGLVYGGDSAGAVVAGTSLRGIESADIPDFTEEVIYEGLSLVPHVVLPHADNTYFQEANEEARRLHDSGEILELTDDAAVIFNTGKKYLIRAEKSEIT